MFIVLMLWLNQTNTIGINIKRIRELYSVKHLYYNLLKRSNVLNYSIIRYNIVESTKHELWTCKLKNTLFLIKTNSCTRFFTRSINSGMFLPLADRKWKKHGRRDHDRHYGEDYDAKGFNQSNGRTSI